MDFRKKRIQLILLVAGIIVLSITAEKCRQLVGEEASSQSGKFTLLNCFDMGSGTLACLVKEGVKLYFYNIRAAHVERARHRAIESALVDAISQGMAAKDSAKYAEKEGAKAAKLASRQAKRIMGPIVSSGWDFFEAIYYGGTITEGFLRGTGTLFGAYAGGFLGEERLGKFGYLVGSHMGSWVGGRIGLMVYDVVNGVHFLLQFDQTGGSEVQETLADESSEAPKNSIFYDVVNGAHFLLQLVTGGSEVQETSADESSESSRSSLFYETPVYDSSEGSEKSSVESSATEESNAYESPADQSYETYEDSETEMNF